jgi:Sec-independent protein secretion pathway component TatC
VLSFLLTAGDLFSAMLLAIPLFGLYELGIVVMRVFLWKK